jgi:ABC-type antimicrobial peptide transport system permease subunit
MREAAVVVALGLIAGLIGAAALGRIFSGVLFGVSAGQPVSYLVGAAVLGLVALGASYVPARRATSIPPSEALRTD